MAKRMNLKKFRGARALTQDQMADRMGVERGTYSLVELGKRRGSPDFWANLQKAFNVPDAEMYALMKEGE